MTVNDVINILNRLMSNIKVTEICEISNEDFYIIVSKLDSCRIKHKMVSIIELDDMNNLRKIAYEIRFEMRRFLRKYLRNETDRIHKLINKI